MDFEYAYINNASIKNIFTSVEPSSREPRAKTSKKTKALKTTFPDQMHRQE